jgi:hypothetical protein
MAFFKGGKGKEKIKSISKTARFVIFRKILPHQVNFCYFKKLFAGNQSLNKHVEKQLL